MTTAKDIPKVTLPRPSPIFVLLDLETTGLDPNHHRILEVATLRVYPGQEAVKCADTGFYGIAQCHPRFHMPANIDPVVVEMHRANGLWRDAAASKDSLEWVLKRLADWLVGEGATPERKVHLVGRSVHFDLGFLVHHGTRTLRDLLSHQVLDIRSLIMFAEALGHNVPQQSSNHRAVSDVQGALSTLRYLHRFWPELPTAEA